MQYFGFDRTLGQMRTFGFGLLEWLPTELFQNNEQGVWYLPEPENLYQDAAMTIPVTANGDPVGAIMDLSGNGNHATQTVSASRPTYQADGILHWLAFDGVDDYYNLGFVASGTNGSAFMISVACKLLSTSAQGDIFEAAGDSGTRGGRIISFNGRYAFQTGTGGAARNTITAGAPTGKDILTLIYDGANMIARVNGTQVGRLNNITYASASTNSFIGSQDNDTEFANMELYGALSYVGVATQEKIEGTEKYLAQKSGVTL